jgi:hypothetical protein
MPGVPDEDHVVRDRRSSQEPQLGRRQPKRGASSRGPVVTPTFPDRDVVLDHLDARFAQARDHLGVSWVVPLVRPEVEDSHLGENLFDVQILALARGGSLFVVARDHLAQEPEREELQADDDEQDAKRQ